MASITIRNLDEGIKTRLRVQAALHDKTVEEEARDILRSALSLTPSGPDDLATKIRSRFASLGGVDLPDLPRAPMREPPGFES